MGLNAGSLDRRIVIQRASLARDAMNSQVATWNPIATVWAKAEPIQDGERLRAGETLASKKYRFTIRWAVTVSQVDPRDRVVFEGRTYDVNGVKEIGRRVGLEITATARAETP